MKAKLQLKEGKHKWMVLERNRGLEHIQRQSTLYFFWSMKICFFAEHTLLKISQIKIPPSEDCP